MSHHLKAVTTAGRFQTLPFSMATASASGIWMLYPVPGGHIERKHFRRAYRLISHNPFASPGQNSHSVQANTPQNVACAQMLCELLAFRQLQLRGHA